jgi:hypothetical protein
MALDAMYPKGEHDDETIERFRNGDDWESDATIHLIKAGKRSNPRFKVLSQQESLVINDRDGNEIIHGKIDGRIEFETGEVAIPEMKSGRSVERVKYPGDFEDSLWTQKQLRQLLIYLLALEVDIGVFITKTYAKPRFIRIELNDWYQQAEQFLQAATIASAAARRETELPDRTESELCLSCDHKARCAPSIGSSDDVVMVDDPAIAEAARIMTELEDSAKKYNKAKETIKNRLRGMTLAIIGNGYELSGRFGANTTYDLPGHIRAKYKTTDPKGKWYFDVRKL